LAIRILSENFPGDFTSTVTHDGLLYNYCYDRTLQWIGKGE